MLKEKRRMQKIKNLSLDNIRRNWWGLKEKIIA